MINTIAFDFDGTIADTFNLSIELVNSIAKNYNLKPFTPRDVENFRSKNMREIFGELHIPLLKAPLILKDIKQRMHKQIDSQLPIAGIPELIYQLKNHGYALDIITSNTIATVTAFLKKHHLEQFDHLYSDKSLFGKHVVLARYLKKHHLNPQQTIYIGDEIRDIEAAHQAKLKIISVTWGFNTKAGLLQYHPDYLVDHPSEILPLISSLNSQ